MPRRPNIKNLPSRLFEDSKTPIYVVDSDLTLIYANPSLLSMLGIDPDELVGTDLRISSGNPSVGPAAQLFAFCPPAKMFPRAKEEAADSVGRDFSFSIALPNPTSNSQDFSACQKFLAQCFEIELEDSKTESVLVCSLHSVPEDQATEKGPYWLNEKIQEFRLGQATKYSALPYLGESPIAKKCFSQARSYALVESNVLIVGHPKSQAIDVAKSIHYSGFSKLDEPEPLLPIDCEQVQGDRIQEILVGHCQVNLSDSNDSKAHVLLMHADQLDPIAQRDLLTMANVDQLQLRMISTSSEPLTSLEGFDSELAHRLSTLELCLPPLSRRPNDIPFLAQEILDRSQGMASTITSELMQLLQIYPWASDYRELETVIQIASQDSRAGELKVSDCPHDFRMALNALENPIPKIESVDLDQLLSDIEIEAIQRAIKQANGNKTTAAKMLGITRARLHRKIAEISDLNGDD